jgi:hypothetical protein
MWCNVYGVQNRFLLIIQETKALNVNFLGVIWNYDHVLIQNEKYDRNYELKKSTFIQKWLTQNMWHIGEIVNIKNNKLQNISFENSFLWKRCFMAKKPQWTIIFNPRKHIGSLNLVWTFMVNALKILHLWDEND